MTTAYQILEDLRQNGTDLSWFMDVDSIKKIYAAVGQTYVPSEKNDEDDEYSEVDDDAIDEIDDGEIDVDEDDE